MGVFGEEWPHKPNPACGLDEKKGTKIRYSTTGDKASKTGAKE
jgi:hypothetical protein